MKHLEAVLWSVFLMWLTSSTSQAAPIPSLKPGDEAPAFSLQTTKKLLTYKRGQPTDIQGPIVMLAFTNESAFLESMLSNPEQFLVDLLEHSPVNAHYIFMFYDNAALDTNNDACKALKKTLFNFIYRYHNPKWYRYAIEVTRVRKWSNYRIKSLLPKDLINHWESKLHFVRFPVHMLGNWIPRVLSQWHCYGPFCGLDQIAIENQNGDVLDVSRRLDARFTWLPSIKSLAIQQARFLVVYVHDACAQHFNVDVKGHLVLIFSEDVNCTSFTKVKNAQENGAVGVIFFGKNLPQQPNCHGQECETYLSIPACVIHSQSGYALKESVVGQTYVRFQTTPSETFTFGIDAQGRVQKTDWVLYPSIRFAAYHAQWFNYVTDFMKNTTGEAKVISIFHDQLVSAVDGISTDIALPSYKDLLLYQNVEIEMSVVCPRTGVGACTHWDHVIRLFVNCESNMKPEYELVRWLVAYERRSTSWITSIRSVLPLLKTNKANKCSFLAVLEESVMPWKITVQLRLSDKMKKMPVTTWREIEKGLVPVQIKSLFNGCFFDENCNKKYQPIAFKVPQNISRVKLVATITGRGRDNNDCAGNCLTTHRFVVNKNAKSTQTKIYKNSDAASGCKVDKRSTSAQRQWLRAREPWCDGQEVIPWEVDISKYVVLNSTVSNTIDYRALYNGTDSKPTHNPGKILMSSYIVYYVYEDLV